MDMKSPLYYSPDKKNIYKNIHGEHIHKPNQQIFIWNREIENECQSRKRHDDVLNKLEGIEKYLYQSVREHHCISHSLLSQMQAMARQNQAFNDQINAEIQALLARMLELETSIHKKYKKNKKRIKKQKKMQEQIFDFLHDMNEDVQNLYSKLIDEYRKEHTHISTQQKEMMDEIEGKIEALEEALQSQNTELVDDITQISKNLKTDLHQLKEKLEALFGYNREQMKDLDSRISELKDLLDKSNPYEYFKMGNRISILDRHGNRYSGVFIEETNHEIIWVDDETNRLSITNKRGITISKET